MTQNDVAKLLSNSFSMQELNSLVKPRHTISEMSKGDKVIVEDKMLDFLRDFFAEKYDGKKIPKAFDKVLIELRNNPTGLFRIFVEFPEDKEDFVYIDVFLNWNHIVKFLFVNVDSNEKDPVSGKYITFMNAITPLQADFSSLSIFIKDVFSYVYLFVEANKDEKTVYKEEKKSQTSPKQASKSKTKGKKSYNPTARDKVFIPKTRRVYNINKITPKVEENIRNYILAEWPVKGYTYTRRKSKDSDEMIEVTVPARVNKRRQPNAGVKKEAQGKDYILTEPKN